MGMCACVACAADYRSREIKYQYGILKNDLIKERDGKILNRFPSGYMTEDEYEKASEYKDKSHSDITIPRIETPSDFMYIPKPLYKIVKYNDPPGSQELSLGKRLFALKQINAQGVVSPDYTKLVYPAVYYYSDNATVDSDLFVIPLEKGENNLNTILKANVSHRDSEPIISTDKSVENYAAFRTLTPVDFSTDSSKLLVKEKIGSSEDGIWETRIYVYDFNTKMKYDLNDVREAVIYFWKEYMKVNLLANRWDIVPIGFLKESPDRVAVQAYAYTGEIPVYLGAWSIDSKGNQSQLITFDKDAVLAVSSNGFIVVKDGVQDYQITKQEEKFQKQQSKEILKQAKETDKKLVNSIKEEYKYKIKDLDEDYRDDAKHYKKLQSLSGSTTGPELEEAYNQYLQDQLNKDIDKAKKQIDKKQKKLDKIENKINSLSLSPQTSKDEEGEGDSNENEMEN